jgi:15-cis-phytoene desaturase
MKTASDQSVRCVRSTAPRVAILGGGMGGLACAHELVRRGVAVTVYEAGAFVGGKARSHYVAGTGSGGRRDLPGEHGFRFYPAFYRHVVETMNEIPDALSPTGFVSGNLCGAPEAGIALDGDGVVATPRRPRNAADVARAVAGVYRVGGNMRDLLRYLAAHFKFLTSCDARREGEIEALSWAAFIGAEAPGKYQESFREVLLSCTRTMVAMNAERGSSRTLGKVSSLLLLDSFGAADVDRTMMGPTSQCWLEPWQADLGRRGVELVFGARVARLELLGGEVARAWLRTAAGALAPIEADAFVLAVPLEVAHGLVTPELAAADPSLARLARLDVGRMTSWMVGAQFFLREDVPLCEGHVFFPRSPWALTAISQGQFWNRGRRGMSTYGDGGLRGILSVDVSACFQPDGDGKRLVDETSREGILRRIFAQVLEAVDPRTRRVLERALYAAHLDDELVVGEGGVTNAGRLLVHPPGSWRDRPEATLAISNLFLAADYVRTAVDLASMEGANEAGRRAARGVLRRLGRSDDAVQLFGFETLERFDRLRAVDSGLHAVGLPHLLDVPTALRSAGRRLGAAA